MTQFRQPRNRALFSSHRTRGQRALALAVVCLLLGSALPARADDAATANKISPHALHQALSAPEKLRLYSAAHDAFSLSSSYFSGYASGASPADTLPGLSSDQRLYALLVDGRYDFTYDTALLNAPLRPYLSGGAGLAAVGGDGGARNIQIEGGTATPLLRFGGGVAYRLGEQWNLSLDYRAGYAPLSSGDQVFTGRGQQSVNLQSLNLGMRLNF